MEYNGWTLVTSKNRSDKSRTRIKDTSAKFHQPIQTANRYTPLNEVRIGSEGTTAVSANGVKKMVKNLSPRETTGSGVIRTKIKKKKVIVIGDSHARGLAVELSASLGKSFEVMGTIMPGSGLGHNITGLASRETSQLQHDEFVIICGGANDINKNESNIGLRNSRKFALQNCSTVKLWDRDAAQHVWRCSRSMHFRVPILQIFGFFRSRSSPCFYPTVHHAFNPYCSSSLNAFPCALFAYIVLRLCFL